LTELARATTERGIRPTPHLSAECRKNKRRDDPSAGKRVAISLDVTLRGKWARKFIKIRQAQL